MKIGYVRVSTEEQNTVRQDALMEELGVDRVYTDKASGSKRDRKGLREMMDYVREGDVVIVESISRFARSVKDLLDLVAQLEEKQVEFISKKEAIDTATPQGKFMMTIFGAMAELEREQILQRQAEGIAAAKAAGKYVGRKPMQINEEKFEELYRDWKNGDTAPKFICKKLEMSNATFYRKVKEYEIKHGIRALEED